MKSEIVTEPLLVNGTSYLNLTNMPVSMVVDKLNEAMLKYEDTHFNIRIRKDAFDQLYVSGDRQETEKETEKRLARIKSLIDT